MGCFNFYCQISWAIIFICKCFVSFVCIFSVYFFPEKKILIFQRRQLFFSLLALYPYFSVEILRESLVISIFLVAMTVFKERKVLSFILCCASILFHKFAFFTILIYILLNI